MKLFTAAQVKQWDAYTIANEPVSSINLMERAATACFNWLQQQYSVAPPYAIFCGRGNNGGDGLAIARLLIAQKHAVIVYILGDGKDGSADFKQNLERLKLITTAIHFIHTEKDFPEIHSGTLVIDALFGTGLNKPLQGIAAMLVNHINQSGNCIIAIDISSGLFADASSLGNTIIHAAHTLSFQQYKLAFLLPENEKYCGNIHILDIGLHPGFTHQEEAVYNMTDTAQICSIYKPRKKFTHKGTYGHAAIIGGSYGMMGAAVLCAQASLRSGAGKLTSFIPECGYTILQTAIPEAMCIVSGEKHIKTVTGMENFDAVGVGPGMGMHNSNLLLLKTIFSASNKPMVVDADALNTIAENKELLPLIPAHSVLTPHPKEFEKLFGKTTNGFEQVIRATEMAAAYHVFIILKGHRSCICTPGGEVYFNTTGNAGMATAGSGDVLTGIITGLLAQAYTPFEAALLGVYIHGAAGDKAAAALSREAMIAGDICCFIGAVFLEIAAQKTGLV